MKLQKFIGTQTKISVSLKPLLMTSLFSHWGITPPGIIPPKRKYVTKLLFQMSKEDQIEFSHPKQFPFNSSLILKIATLSNCGEPELQRKVVNATFKAVWLNNLNCESEEEVAKLLDQFNLPGTLLTEMDPLSTKKELKANLKEAISRDIFGVPTLIEDENLENMHWGQDQIEKFLISL